MRSLNQIIFTLSVLLIGCDHDSGNDTGQSGQSDKGSMKSADLDLCDDEDLDVAADCVDDVLAAVAPEAQAIAPAAEGDDQGLDIDPALIYPTSEHAFNATEAPLFHITSVPQPPMPVYCTYDCKPPSGPYKYTVHKNGICEEKIVGFRRKVPYGCTLTSQVPDEAYVP